MGNLIKSCNNPNTISSIELHDKEKIRDFEHKEAWIESSFFGFFKTEKPAGFYSSNTYRYHYYTATQLAAGEWLGFKVNVKEGEKELFYRPYVRVVFNNPESNYCKKFDTLAEADKLYVEMKKKYHIKITSKD